MKQRFGDPQMVCDLLAGKGSGFYDASRTNKIIFMTREAPPSRRHHFSDEVS